MITDFQLKDFGVQGIYQSQDFDPHNYKHTCYGQGTDAESALDVLLENLATSGFDLTGLEGRIKDEWSPSTEEGDGATTYYCLGIMFNPLYEGFDGLYREAYERNWDDEHKSLRAMRKELQTQCNERLFAEKKKRQPRKRVHFDTLPEEVSQAIVDDIKSSAMFLEVERLDGEVKKEKEIRESLLNTMARSVEMVPDQTCSYRLRTVSSGSYGSQGYGAMKYARGALEPLLDMLEGHGFTARILLSNHRTATGSFGINHCDYALWSNCPPWMFDAANRCLSLHDWADSLKRRCVNPLVYNAFLPDSCVL
jgi:hypothetical protein